MCADPIEDRYGSIEVDNRGGVITKTFCASLD